MQKISEPVKRFDFDDKIDGSARYCADIRLEGMLYARTFRSSKPRARILSIDLPTLPEGYFIVDSHDIPGKNIVPVVYEDMPFLARDIVNYAGEPILLVVGPDKAKILEILRHIKINYEELQPVLSLEEAIERKEDFIYGDKPYFVEYEFSKGDFAKASNASVRCIEDEFSTGYQEHAYLETQGMAAEYEGGMVTVSGSMQCPYYIKEALEQALGWSGDRIRVIQLPTGGGFGGKEEYPSIVGVHAALAAIKAQRPVQLVFDRQEDIVCSTKRHPSVIRLKSYLDSENHITAREIDVMTDAGAYAGLSGVVLQRIIYSASGVYKVDNLKVRGRAYATNKVMCGAFRGFGGPQAFFAIELHMENIAQQLKLDPVEFKKSHFLHMGDTSSTGGLLHSDIRLEELIDEVDRLSGYSIKRRSRKKLRGIGCSVFYHGCGFTGAGERDIIKPVVKLRKNSDGTVRIFVSSTEIGQGAITALSKITANELGIPYEKVSCRYPDTMLCPNSGPTVASRTIMIVGRLLQDAAREMKRRWSETEFELDCVYKYPENMYWDKDNHKGNAYPEYAWGANVVEAEIDPVTCSIDIKGVWAAYDIGTPIDERIVSGQIEGGMIQGLGYGCMEVLGTSMGEIMQKNLTDYIIPTSMDFPPVVYSLLDNEYERGPFGAKGLGELPHVGAAPALALAVQDALGVKVTRIPVTPEYVMELMNNGKGN